MENYVTYSISQIYNNINSNKINIENILSNKLFLLLKEINTNIIDNVFIFNNTDILIVMKNYGKNIGLGQLYLMFRTSYHSNSSNNVNILLKDLLDNDNDNDNNNDKLLEEYSKRSNINLNHCNPVRFLKGILSYDFEENILEKLHNNILKENINFTLKFELLNKIEQNFLIKKIIITTFNVIFENFEKFILNINTMN
jgi:hypothetical protein